MLNSYDIGKLDISRIYRYLNKYLGIEIENTDEVQTAINTNGAESHDYQNEETIDEWQANGNTTGKYFNFIIRQYSE